ncbi:MAG: glycosyltransferase [Actinobacteria bacterium]|nr:glycosyltransferase [Actinomycetota bacterium]
MPSNNLTSIIILGNDQLEYTKFCIESIHRYTTPLFELILVDNGSTDGTAEYFDSIVGARVIKNKTNQGFAKGYNRGIKAAKGDYILLIGNDTIVTGYWLENLIACLESEPSIGIVGPRSNYASGRQFIETSYTTVEDLHRFAGKFNRQGPEEWFEVDTITGLCMLIKREIIDKIGVFDERFSVGSFEGNDFCARAKAAGYRLVCAGNTFIHHLGSRTLIGSQPPYDNSVRRSWGVNKGQGEPGCEGQRGHGAESLLQTTDGVLFKKTKLALDKFEAERGELSKLFHQGLVDYVDGRYDRALQALQELQQKLPSSAYVKHAHGLTLMMLGKFNEAEALLADALRQRPDNVGLMLAYGDCLAALGKLGDAEKHYKEVLDRGSPRVSARMGMAVVKKIKRQPELLKFINDLEALVNLKIRLAKELNEHFSMTYIAVDHAVADGSKVYFEHINRLIKQGHSVSIVSYWPQPGRFDICTEVITVPFDDMLCDYVSPESDLVIATSWRQIYDLIKVESAAHAYFVQDDCYPLEADEQRRTHCYLPEVKWLDSMSHNLPISILVTSDELRELVQKHYGRESTIIPNAIDLSVFKPVRRRKKQKPRLLMIGPDDPTSKGLRCINEAFQQVKHTCDVEITWISPEPRRSLQIKCDTFIQSPTQAELAKIYTDCDIFVFASVYGGSSLPPIEAMACGTPVIVVIGDGIKGYVRDGRNCLAVPDFDANAIFAAINRLLGDELLRERIIKGGIETAAKYSWQRAINKLEEKLWNLALTPKIPLVAVLPEEALEKSTEGVSDNAVGAGQLYFEQLDIIELVPTDAKQILDVGCATGTIGKTLKERGATEVVGIEAVEMVAREAERYLDRVIIGNIEQIDLDYEDGYFDCVILASMLEHLYNPWQVLAKLRRYLAPNGKLICSIPNIGHVSILRKLLNGSWKYKDTDTPNITHPRFFTLEGAVALLISAGFKIENVANKILCDPDEKSFLNKLRVSGLSTDKYLQHAATYQFLITAAPSGDQPYVSVTMPADLAGIATSEGLGGGDSLSLSNKLASRFITVSGSAQDTTKKPRLSLAMVVKNEADNLGRCLESVQGVADEIVVVDIGSTDNTVAIAQKFRAKVIHYEQQDNYLAAANISLEHSTGDWVIFLDASEELAREDIVSLKELLEDTEHEGFFFNEFSFIGGKEDDGAVINITFRLWRNKPTYRFSSVIREQIVAKVQSYNPNIGFAGIRINRYGHLSQTTKEKDRIQQNLNILLKEVEKHPYDVFVRLNIGIEYLKLKDYEKALDQYKKAFANLSGLDASCAPMLVRNIALCLKWLGRHQESLKVLKDAEGAYPGYTDLFYIEGLVRLAGKDFAPAIKCFKRCLAMGPARRIHISQPGVGGHIAARALAYAYREIGNEQEAVATYKKVLKDNTRDCLAISALGLMLIPHESPDNLKLFLEPLVDMTSEDVLFTLSFIFGQGGYYDVSLGYLDRPVGINSNSSRAAFLRGDCLFNLKRYHEAIAELKRVSKSSQFYPAASVDGVLCHLLLGEYEDAAKAIDSIKGNEELNLTHQLYSSIISLMGGRPSTAAISDGQMESCRRITSDLLRKFLELEEFEAFENAVKFLDKFDLPPGKTSLLLGKIYYDVGYSEMAVEELINAYESGYADGEAFCMLGRTASNNGFYEEAKTFFFEALSRGTEELTLYVSLGRALIKLGEIDRATEVLDTGAKKYPDSPLIAEVRQSISALV